MVHFTYNFDISFKLCPKANIMFEMASVFVYNKCYILRCQRGNRSYVLLYSGQLKAQIYVINTISKVLNTAIHVKQNISFFKNSGKTTIHHFIKQNGGIRR